MEPLEVQFTIDREDWIAYHKHHLFSGKHAKKKIRRRSMLTGVLTGMLLLTFLMWGGDSERVKFVGIIAVALLASFMLPFLRRYRLIRGAGKAADKEEVFRNFGPQKVTFYEDRLVNEMPMIESKIPWSALAGYEQNEDYFFLYTNPHTAIVIPKKKIDKDPSAVDALLKEKIPAAKVG